MKNPTLLNGTEVERRIIAQLQDSDWDDLLRIYRAACDPDAELVEQTDGSFLLKPSES